MAEHSAVNRGVVGSTPTWGAIYKKRHSDYTVSLCFMNYLLGQYKEEVLNL